MLAVPAAMSFRAAAVVLEASGLPSGFSLSALPAASGWGSDSFWKGVRGARSAGPTMTAL